MTEPGFEQQHEQQIVTEMYLRLDELRSVARNRLHAVRLSGPSGSPQNRSERDAFATLYEDRLAQLDAVEDRLCFGRLDFDDSSERYIGRLGLKTSEHDTLLTDWRAPAAEPFYRATALHPDGVWRRRHLVTKGRTLVHIDDDLLNADAMPDDGSASPITGEGALFAALARGRTGHMTDIVATIQSEQDAIIRSDLAGALVVQGGPGTGKTAVALHRAAYLLYAHRRRLENAGVLVIGPTRTFLRYIDQVLPSLGETGVVSSTIATLLPGLTATGTDSALAAKVKGDATMAGVVARAVAARQRVPDAPVRLRVDGIEIRIRPGDVRDAISRARRSHKPHNDARAGFVKDMLNRLVDQYISNSPTRPSGDDRPLIYEELRSTSEIRVALNLAWFPISAQALIRDLYAKPHRLAEAAPHLSSAERAALHRDRSAPWTPGDVPLLDEAAELLGGDEIGEQRAQIAADAQRKEALEYARDTLEANDLTGGMVDADTLADRFMGAPTRATAAERAAHDRSWTYGHVVVDEAQELSAMAWRALLRRCPTRSFTIVGDVAQTSSPGGTRSWMDRLSPLFAPNLRTAELTVNYRTPSTVADCANDIGRALGLPISTLTSARDVPDSLVVDHADSGTLAQVALAHATQEMQGMIQGRVAILGAEEDLVRVRLAASAPEFADLPTTASLSDDIALVMLTPGDAKGLEFDVVVLLEPVTVLAGIGSAADLYVSMTRPTQRLIIVHEQPLPAALAAGLPA